MNDLLSLEDHARHLCESILVALKEGGLTYHSSRSAECFLFAYNNLNKKLRELEKEQP